MIGAFLLLASASQGASSGDYQDAYEKAFRSSFRARSIEQCRGSAKNAAGTDVGVTAICTCATDRLLATRSVDELKARPSPAEIRSLIIECIEAHPPAMGAATP